MRDHPDNSSNFGEYYWQTQASAVERIDEPDLDEVPYRLLAEYLPTLCWCARADGSVMWYNRRWHIYCGTKPGDVEGWGWTKVHSPEDLPRIIEAWTASIAAGEPCEVIFNLRGADGISRPFLNRAIPLRDASGAIVRWFGINTEIGGQVEAETALRASEAKFFALTNAMPQIVWSALADGEPEYYNAQWYLRTGMVVMQPPPSFLDAIHPEDRPAVELVWRRSLADGEPFEIECRLIYDDGEGRWTLCRAMPQKNGGEKTVRWIGTFTDIDAAKRDRERIELLSRELTHRIKNVFSIVSALVRLSAGDDTARRAWADDLIGRIVALGRAHDLARPPEDGEKGTTHGVSLRELLVHILAPYPANDEGRVFFAGDDMFVPDEAVSPLGLVFHEMATNAMKYGALSGPKGRLRLTFRRDGAQVVVVWKEEDGPPIVAQPECIGFGTRLAIMSIERQLRGAFDRCWERDGLVATITFQA